MTKGYFVASGYMGWIESEHRFMLFATEADYLDYISENDEEE